jgi:hypothetical protein
MKVIFSPKVIITALIVSLTITALTYFVALETAVTGAFIPITIQYTVISAATTSGSTAALLHGWPFAWLLTNEAVSIVSFFAFILDFIIFLALSFCVLWILFRTDSVDENMQLKRKQQNKVIRR